MATSNLTIMFWHRLNALQNTEFNLYYSLIDDWNDGQPGWTMHGLNLTPGTPAEPIFQVEPFDGNNDWVENVNYIRLSSAVPQALNEWHHYAYTKAGSLHKLYVDGKEVDRGTLVQPEVTDGWLGGYESFGTPDVYWAPGVYDANWIGTQFRMYTRTLTEDEIYAEAQSPTAANSTLLFRDMPLLTANGQDAGAAENDMTLIGNTVSWTP